MASMSTSHSTRSDSTKGVPSGYTRLTDGNGSTYLIPDYILPSAQFSADVENKKTEMNILKAQGGPLSMQDLPAAKIGPDGDILVPPIPALSQRELLDLHAEIKTLQARYGISYKDAAQRLYHAEIEKLSALKSSEKIFSKACNELDHIIGTTEEQEIP